MNIAPAGAVSSGPTTYEVDCVGSGLAAGQTAPFIQGLNVNTSADNLAPTGATFGVSGTATETLIGPIVAGAEQVVNLSTFGLGAILSGVTVGSTDGTATGSFTYNHTFPNQPVSGRQVLGVSYTAGTPTLTGAPGTFLASDVGTPTNPMFVAGPSFPAVGGTPTIDPNSTVVSVAADGSSATISLNTLQTQAGVTIGLGQTNTFVDPTFSTGNVFTTNGVAGGHANIGITSMSSITLIVVPGVIQATFGGSPGVGSTNCLLTGYDAVGNPGPSQFGDTTPADPVIMHPQYVAAGITPLVAASGGFITQPGTTQAITPPAAAFVNLVVCNALSITTTTPLPDATQGQPYSTTLTSAGGFPPVDSWTASGLPAGLSVDPATGVISGTPTQSGDFSVTATVTDSCPLGAQTATSTLALHVVAADNPPVASDAAATINRNVSNSTTLTLPATDADATPVASCSQVGSASDPRLTVSISNAPTPCVATLTDTGGASQAPSGPITFQFNATDTRGAPVGTGNTATVTVTITPVPHVAITQSGALPEAPIGVPYSTTLTATGGTPPFTWSVSSGSLPPGLTLDPSTGVISGTPAGPTGISNFTVMVTDSDSPAETATAALSINVTVLPACDASMNVIVGGVRSGASGKTFVAKVTNVGTASCTVSDTDIANAITVNGAPTTGSIAPLNPGTFTLGPGASKRFRFHWTYGAGEVTPGATVVFSSTVTAAGDANAANNSESETRIAK
jgi:large repetitive protein